MQQQHRQILDLTGNLEPLVAAGFKVDTPNYRLARRVKRQWDEQQALQGTATWAALASMPLESWMMARWQQAVASAVVPAATVLTEGQALDVWHRVIEQAQAESGD